jgi:hypothetical protein
MDRPCNKRYEKKKLLESGRFTARRRATLDGFWRICVTTALDEEAIDTMRNA